MKLHLKQKLYEDQFSSSAELWDGRSAPLLVQVVQTEFNGGSRRL